MMGLIEIWTADTWCRKRQIYQLSHHYCLSKAYATNWANLYLRTTQGRILFAKRYFFISSFWFSSISTFPRCKIFYSLACCFQQLNFLFPTLWHALSISRSTTYTNTRSLTHSVLRFFVKLSEKIVTGKQNETALIFLSCPIDQIAASATVLMF